MQILQLSPEFERIVGLDREIEEIGNGYQVAEGPLWWRGYARPHFARITEAEACREVRGEPRCEGVRREEPLPRSPATRPRATAPLRLPPSSPCPAVGSGVAEAASSLQLRARTAPAGAAGKLTEISVGAGGGASHRALLRSRPRSR